VSVAVRPAAPADLPLIASLIRELAEYERLGHLVRFYEADLAKHLFAERPAAEVLIGELDGAPQGFALFFPTFSTFEGRPGLWLEDIFVRPDARGRDLGKALIGAVAALAVERGCARFEWAVLDWNRPAIDFYEGAGARMMGDWRIMRLEGEALAALSGGFTGT
jgi:GNAT superfamily N-acetyltransferase